MSDEMAIGTGSRRQRPEMALRRSFRTTLCRGLSIRVAACGANRWETVPSKRAR